MFLIPRLNNRTTLKRLTFPLVERIADLNDLV